MNPSPSPPPLKGFIFMSPSPPPPAADAWEAGMKDIGPMILLYDWISKGNVVGDSWVFQFFAIAAVFALLNNLQRMGSVSSAEVSADTALGARITGTASAVPGPPAVPAAASSSAPPLELAGGTRPRPLLPALPTLPTVARRPDGAAASTAGGIPDLRLSDILKGQWVWLACIWAFALGSTSSLEI
jgi:hypothetical protein